MKILISCSSVINIGSGILAYCKNIAMKYKSDGHEVLFVYMKSENNQWLIDNNFESLSLDPDGNPEEETNALYAKILEFCPDVVINNDNLYLQALAPKITAPFVFVLHLGNYSILSLAKINKDYVDRYIATTSDMKFDLVKIGVDSSKISVVLNGLNKPIISEMPSLKNNCVHVLFAGEPTLRKGYDKFLKLLSKHDFNGYHFHWTGGEKARDKLSKVRHNNKVTVYDRLNKSEFYDLMSKCEVFLMPSRDEGLPIALLEAMGFGLMPIVSNARGGMKEVVLHGRTGFVCDQSKWESESSTILNNLNKKELSIIKENVLAYANKELLCGNYADDILNVATTLSCNKKTKSEITYYKWHRPSVHGAKFHTRMIRRIKVRFGIITKSGSLI